jgi:polyisoprenoid-binding protein YceI
MGDPGISYSISSTRDSTIAAEIVETRWLRKCPYFLSFETFQGNLLYCPEHLEKSRLTLDIDAKSIMCRDRRLRSNKQRRAAEYVRHKVLNTADFPAVQFASHLIAAKPLRGLIVDGSLTMRGAERPFKMNAVFTPTGQNRLEIEADSILRLSDFDIRAPSFFWGMVKIGDQALIQIRLQATVT